MSYVDTAYNPLTFSIVSAPGTVSAATGNTYVVATSGVTINLPAISAGPLDGAAIRIITLFNCDINPDGSDNVQAIQFGTVGRTLTANSAVLLTATTSLGAAVWLLTYPDVGDMTTVSGDASENDAQYLVLATGDGYSNAGGTGGSGGYIQLDGGAGGDGTTLSGVGGGLNINTGAGGAASAGVASQGGGVIVTTGIGGIGTTLSGAGGVVNITTAAGGSDGGSGLGTGGEGGNFTALLGTGGSAGTAGDGGSFVFTAGQGGASETPGAGGSVTITSGGPGVGGTGWGITTISTAGSSTDTVAPLRLQSQGTNSGVVDVFVGSQNPSGVITATDGALYLRTDDGNSALYVNTSTTTGTTWAVAGGATTLQDAYTAAGALVLDVTGSNDLAFDTATPDGGGIGLFAITRNNGGALEYTVLKAPDQVDDSPETGTYTFISAGAGSDRSITAGANGSAGGFLNLLGGAGGSAADASGAGTVGGSGGGAGHVLVVCADGGLGGDAAGSDDAGDGGTGGTLFLTGGLGGAGGAAVSGQLAGDGGIGTLFTFSAGTGGAGGAASVAGGTPGTGGIGGSITVDAGTGGAGGTPTDTLFGTGGAGGAFTLRAGTGGDAVVEAGSPSTIAGVGGSFVIQSGDGGDASTTAAVSVNGADAGDISITAGAGGAPSVIGNGGTGGNVNILAGAGDSGGSGAGLPGNLLLDAGKTPSATTGSILSGSVNPGVWTHAGQFVSLAATGSGDTVELLSLNNSAETNGATADLYSGTRDPAATVSADPGSVYFRTSGTGSSVYVNTGATAGTTWTDLAAAGGGGGVADTTDDQTLQTTNATQTTVATYATLADDQAIIIKALVWGLEPTTGDRITTNVTVSAYRDNSSVVTVDDETYETYFVVGDGTNWLVDFNVSSQNILVQVTGEAATTIEWRCQLEVSEHG